MYVPTNSPDYQKDYKNRHYADNKAYYVAKAAARKLALKEEVNAIKESSPCVDCNTYYPYYVMDFDHREGENKVGDVARMVANNQRNAVYAEIKKCDIVCSNCHRERTYQREQAGVV